MPYSWSNTPAQASPAAPAELRLWPHRSLTNRGFAAFIGITAALLALPLLVLLGNPALWVILPFIALAITLVWWAIRRNDRDRSMTEVMQLTPDRLTLVRRDPGGRERRWETNPYWVTVRLYADSGPVPSYLTLKGQDREVELGAFLSEEERVALRDELAGAIAALR